LSNMKRGYTRAKYRELIHKVREIIPEAAIHCDIIVGFPGETEAQFQKTYDILEELRLDKIHLARYSSRAGTVSARAMADDVPDAEKRRRFHLIEGLQKEVSQEKMKRFLGRTEEVLVEGKQKDRWRGRNPQNKLVFFNDSGQHSGQIVPVLIKHTGPWSMSGELVKDSRDVLTQEPIQSIPLALI